MRAFSRAQGVLGTLWPAQLSLILVGKIMSPKEIGTLFRPDLYYVFIERHLSCEGPDQPTRGRKALEIDINN
jgi:hypothetical protein